MVAVAQRLLASKRELQQEIRDDMKRPEFRKAIHEVKKSNAKRTK
jgi:hypothetical protein